MVRIIRTCSFAVAVAATVLATPPARADVPQSLGAYVRARAADAAGNDAAAVAGYRTALGASPGNTVIAARAYREAIGAGDMALARSAAKVLQTAGVAPPDAIVLDLTGAIREKRWQDAIAAADRLAGGPLDFLAPAVKAWIAFDRGAGSPEAGLASQPASPLARRFDAENHALLLIATGKTDAGVAELRALIGAGQDNINLRIAAAQLLLARGERTSADALLAGDDPVLAAVRATPGARIAPGAVFGISRLYVRLAADLVEGQARPLAILLCRAALELDPHDDRARLTLAGALSNDGAQDRALALVDAVDPDGPYRASAKAISITMLTRAGRNAQALAAAEAIDDAKGADADDAQRLGDLLVDAGRFADAAAAYATAMRRSSDGDRDWTLNLQRGGALEQAGRWDEALPFLERAVALAPGEAHALNYLGYAQIERGVNLVAARALLERAAKLQPNDSAIADSLGWAYVRTGQLTKGLPLLETAARAEPGDTTIQEHLGDAYWSLGRRYEARYAWRAAALQADAAEAARLAGKLAAGLPR